MIQETSNRLSDSQNRYKNYFYARARKAIYLRKENRDGHQHKLSVKAYGPFEVLVVGTEEKTINIRRKYHEERVNENRFVLAGKPDDKKVTKETE